MKDLTDEEKRIQKAYISILEGLWEQEYRYNHGGRSYEEEQEKKMSSNSFITYMKWGIRRYKIPDYIDDK